MGFYIESDFILAMIKESDWLESAAGKLYEEHKGELYTSAQAVLEVLMVLDLEDIDNFPALVEDILGIADLLYLEEEKIFQAAFYMEEGATPFDAFHAAISKDMPIISSDKKYDELGIDRIELEPEE